MSFSAMDNKFLYLLRNGNIGEAKSYIDYSTVRLGKEPHFDSCCITIAIQNKDADILDFLAEHGADFKCDPPNNSNGSFMHQAIASNSLDLVLSLIKHGAPLDQKDNLDRTPMALLIQENDASKRVRIAPTALSALIKAGADPNQTSFRNNTALSLACLFSQTELADIILKQPCNVNHQNDTGETALHLVAEKLSLKTDLVQKLLENGAKDDIANNKGLTALSVVPEQNKEAFLNIIEKFKENKMLLLKKQIPAHKKQIRLKRRPKTPKI